MGQSLSMKKIKRIGSKESIRSYSSIEETSGVPSVRIPTRYEILWKYRTILVDAYDSDFSAPVEDTLASSGKMMEAGHGSGSWIIGLAGKYPNSEFVGLGLGPIIPNTLPRNLKFVKESLLYMSYEDDEFDFLRTGELQSTFTEVEYELAIKEMIRVTKRGGWIEINEPSLTPQKRATYFSKIIVSFCEFLALRGINMNITEKIQYMLYSNDLQNIQFDCKRIFFGPGCNEIGKQVAEVWLKTFKEIHGQDLADHLGITYEEYLQTLFKKAEEEVHTLNLEIRLYRFWGQKKF